MSRQVRTRTADQCRSHHQKMMKYHRDIPNIIAHVQSLLDPSDQQADRPTHVKVEEGTRLKIEEEGMFKIEQGTSMNHI